MAIFNKLFGKNGPANLQVMPNFKVMQRKAQENSQAPGSGIPSARQRHEDGEAAHSSRYNEAQHAMMAQSNQLRKPSSNHQAVQHSGKSSGSHARNPNSSRDRHSTGKQPLLDSDKETTGRVVLVTDDSDMLAAKIPKVNLSTKNNARGNFGLSDQRDVPVGGSLGGPNPLNLINKKILKHQKTSAQRGSEPGDGGAGDRWHYVDEQPQRVHKEQPKHFAQHKRIHSLVTDPQILNQLTIQQKASQPDHDYGSSGRIYGGHTTKHNQVPISFGDDVEGYNFAKPSEVKQSMFNSTQPMSQHLGGAQNAHRKPQKQEATDNNSIRQQQRAQAAEKREQSYGAVQNLADAQNTAYLSAAAS